MFLLGPRCGCVWFCVDCLRHTGSVSITCCHTSSYSKVSNRNHTQAFYYLVSEGGEWLGGTFGHLTTLQWPPHRVSDHERKQGVAAIPLGQASAAKLCHFRHILCVMSESLSLCRLSCGGVGINFWGQAGHRICGHITKQYSQSSS